MPSADRSAVRRASPEPDMLRLQRAVGNRAIGGMVQRRVLQRTAVAPSAYLTAIQTNGPASEEWDPQWTAAVGKVVHVTDFTHFPPTIDDATEDGPRVVANILKGIGPISNDAKSYRLTVDAIRWSAGIESDAAGSGFGSLDTSTTGASGISGRPAFPKITQVNIPLRAGQHRRHILAWHTIREFVSLAHAAHPKAVIGSIWQKYHAPADDASGQAFAEAHQHVASGREKSHAGSGGLTDEEMLKIGLFVMNGNPRNLWPGKGSTNSAINTAQMHINSALNEVKTFNDVAALAEKWDKAPGKVVYSTATTLAATVLWQKGTEALSVWDQTKEAAKEKDYVASVVQAVQQYVVSNLEIDVMSDVKAQNEIAHEKAEALREPIMLIDNVVSGTVAAANVDPGFIDVAMAEFLTYIK
jgi:hypothetical protein